MSHWSAIVKEILQAKTGDLRKLSELANHNPSTFFTYQSLSGCDLRGQDLSGMDLTGCDVEEAILDHDTILDEEFEFRSALAPGYFSFNIPSRLYLAIDRFADHYNYIYRAWAYKNLIGRFTRAMNGNRIAKIVSTATEQKEIYELVLKQYEGPTERLVILLNNSQILALEKFNSRFPEFDRYSFALMSGLILARIPYARIGLNIQLPMDALWEFTDGNG